MGCGCNKNKKRNSRVALTRNSRKRNVKSMPLVKISSKIKTVKKINSTSKNRG